MKTVSSPLVSIIIPVYNTEEYLDQCLQSAISQDYENLEIIIVNDGSTDNSSNIIDKYAENDPRIIKIDKTNGGLVEARKSGLDVARGKYIQYLDGDDALRENVISLLAHKAEETHADIVVAPFFWCTGTDIVRSAYGVFEPCSGIDFFKDILCERAYWCIWSKFHLRSLYIDIERPSISFGEDVVLSTQLLLHARRVVSIDIEIINYTVRSTSISHYQNFDDRKYKDFNSYIAWMDTYVSKKGLSHSLKKEMAFFHMQNTFRRIEWGKYCDVNIEMKKVIQNLRIYSEMKNGLSRRKQKIIAAYRVANFLGYWNLLRYKKQGKI